MNSIIVEDIEQLLTLFSRKGQYDARAGEQNYEIHKKCEDLFEKDYVISKIENEKGSLSTNYPSQIIIPVEEKSCLSKDLEFSNKSVNCFNALKFKEIANKSNLARCRTRFPVPVILFKGKYVCRSATLACGGEMLLRDMSGFVFNSSSSESEEKNYTSYSRNGALFTELRSQDIKLLKELSVNYICDLMVENKKVKYGLKVSSSEKIDKENRYCDFKIIQLPYPGCEFFKKFKDSNYVAEGLMFDWEQNYVDSSLTLPSDSIASTLGVHWSNYKMWDLVKLTQNYLKLLVTYITEGTSSILIHCISGWDRTPLFISLLRLTLWADGRIHTSLSPVEMAYLTLAYDWYLFGHDLPSRLKVGEEILFFCFEFLKFITSEEFSSKKRNRKISSNCTDPPLDILIEEELPEQSSLKTCGSDSSFQKFENGTSSIFYTSLEGYPNSLFYSSVDSGDESSDSFKSVRSNSQNDSYLSDSEITIMANSTDSSVNINNSHGNLAPSSSPVPVPNSRPRMDSTSSLGSWQYVSGTGSLLGSVTSKGSSAEMNSNSSSSGSHAENGNVASTSSGMSSAQERNDKLIAVRTLIHRAYRKAIEHKDTSVGERYYYFPWRR
ncbi:phosphatidylinositol-3,5-bisphosphate 3-phosphatase MTMR14 [Parasteatoda tepidariorum]|uniref:phosphatidylinositol-3,5-bisphosphate 3-phosphatase MTMR14 n=1 Tax=Parasteatoda tepidariorum TaxID=114398 RepID=UPI00077F8768|nr:myotubularin-related protein 14 isoform X1 [Parasteatoda tepidariorum]XP_042903258.1 myotubularin-related protein 14 isoform X2 [Parasteatoda tepidariorum]